MRIRRAIFFLIGILLVLTSCVPREVPPIRTTRTPTTRSTSTPRPTLTPFSPRIPPDTITRTAEPSETLEPSMIPVREGHFFVAPNGSEEGDGSIENPWSLQKALDHPEQVQPGDIIWLRGGVYRGEFFSRLKGTEEKPITVRQYPGERVTLDAMEEDKKVLWIQDTHWVNFWGFEVTASSNTREKSDRPGDGGGIVVDSRFDSHHIKFINLIVHDIPAQGFGFWRANSESEIYGSLIYYNGVNQFDHGIYTQNANGSKYIEDNFIFNNSGYGIHAYGSANTFLDNFHLEGNTIFNNGSVGYNTNTGMTGQMVGNILVGGEVITRNPVLIENYTYFSNSTGLSVNVGYKAGSEDAVLMNNYFMGGRVVMGGQVENVQLSGNVMLGNEFDGLALSLLGSNLMLSQPPSENQIFLRPNRYEPGRANVTIFNWQRSAEVMLDADLLSKVGIVEGDHYALHNVQDYFYDVISGVYDGRGIVVPMEGHTIAQPVGLDFLPPTTFPEFGAFVLQVEQGN